MDKNATITKLIKGTFESEFSKKLIAHLEKTFVDRDIYKHGQTLEETAYRQGQADVIKQIIREINYGR